MSSPAAPETMPAAVARLVMCRAHLDLLATVVEGVWWEDLRGENTAAVHKLTGLQASMEALSRELGTLQEALERGEVPRG